MKTKEKLVEIARWFKGATFTFVGKKARHISDIVVSLNRPYLVKGLLLPKQVSVLAAPPNTGKSSIVAALLACIAQGIPFAGLRVKKAAVIYVGAEDPEGIAIRAHGHFITDEAKAAANFHVLDQAVDVSNLAAVHQFTKDMNILLKRTRATRSIIVFDTLTLSIGDSDENVARDMTRVMENAQQLARQTGAHVMFVHHTSAADAKKARGSTALVGNADTVLLLDPVKGGDLPRVLLESFKQRSLPKLPPFGFEIEAQELGYDDDNDLVTNPFADWVEDISEWNVGQTSKRSAKNLGEDRAREVLRVLRELEDLGQADGEGQPFGSSAIAKYVHGPFDRTQMKSDSLQKAVREGLAALVKSGKVEKVGTHKYRTVRRNQSGLEDVLEYATLH